MSNYEANDAYVALQDRNDNLETELAATKAELAEANAVIERVRKVQANVTEWKGLCQAKWARPGGDDWAAWGKASAYLAVETALNGVEGL